WRPATRTTSCLVIASSSALVWALPGASLSAKTRRRAGSCFASLGNGLAASAALHSFAVRTKKSVWRPRRRWASRSSFRSRAWGVAEPASKTRFPLARSARAPESFSSVSIEQRSAMATRLCDARLTARKNATASMAAVPPVGADRRMLAWRNDERFSLQDRARNVLVRRSRARQDHDVGRSVESGRAQASRPGEERGHHRDLPYRR